jgi:4-amino-4-deoxy-L-arabinose transferase-like glycosyltransferase
VTEQRFLLTLVAIAIAAFAGRAIYILTVTQHETAFYDRVYYEELAKGLADGDGFKAPASFGTPDAEDALHPPLTAITLAPVARVTGDNELAMRLTVALAGTGVVLLAGLIGRELVGARAGLIAAGLAAVYPNLWMNDGLIMAETFGTLGTAATVFCAYRLVRAPSSANAAGVGVSCALAMLSRGELALLVPLVAVPAVVLIANITVKRRLWLAGVVTASVLALVAPWAVYNLIRFEKPVLLSHGDGGALAGANCDTTYSGPRLGSWHGFCYAGEGRHLREGSRSAEHARELALEYMREHAGRLPVVAAARVARSWSVYRPFQMVDDSVNEGRPRWASWSGLAMYWALVPLAVAGAVALRRRKVPVVLLVGPLIVATLVAAAFYGLVRFRAFAEVSLVVLAAVAVDSILSRTRNGELHQPPAGAVMR